jgi:hypothetical protein
LLSIGIGESSEEVRPAGLAEADPEAPSSGLQRVESQPVRLRDNESFARVSRAGVVIRRGRRA